MVAGAIIYFFDLTTCMKIKCNNNNNNVISRLMVHSDRPCTNMGVMVSTGSKLGHCVFIGVCICSFDLFFLCVFIVHVLYYHFNIALLWG